MRKTLNSSKEATPYNNKVLKNRDKMTAQGTAKSGISGHEAFILPVTVRAYKILAAMTTATIGILTSR
jgi:hypothetical protein